MLLSLNKHQQKTLFIHNFMYTIYCIFNKSLFYLQIFWFWYKKFFNYLLFHICIFYLYSLFHSYFYSYSYISKFIYIYFHISSNTSSSFLLFVSITLQFIILLNDNTLSIYYLYLLSNYLKYSSFIFSSYFLFLFYILFFIFSILLSKYIITFGCPNFNIVSKYLS